MYWKGTALPITVALLVAGCGATRPLTKAEFAQRVEAACARNQATAVSLMKISAAQQETTHVSAAQLHARLFPKYLAALRRQLKEIEALTPPTELQATFAQWKRALADDIQATYHPVRLNSPQAATVHVLTMRREALKTRLGIKRECA